MNSDYDVFDDLINQSLEKHGLKPGEEDKLKDNLPKVAMTDENVKLVKLNGLALTNTGVLTKTSFFENLNANMDQYNHITLTPEQADSLAMAYRRMSTGVTAATPIICTADRCPFKKDCWFYDNGKAPMGLQCAIEVKLLNDHIIKLIEEYNVDMNNHSELMFIQELAETYILETRVTKVLARPENAEMYGISFKFSPDGEAVEEQVIHWAFELKERIKNRRLKIMDALMGTRKSKATIVKDIVTQAPTYYNFVEKIKKEVEIEPQYKVE